MYRVIKELAGFEMDEVITKDKIKSLFITNEVLESWEKHEYIKKVEELEIVQPQEEKSTTQKGK